MMKKVILLSLFMFLISSALAVPDIIFLNKSPSAVEISGMECEDCSIISSICICLPIKIKLLSNQEATIDAQGQHSISVQQVTTIIDGKMIDSRYPDDSCYLDVIRVASRQLGFVFTYQAVSDKHSEGIICHSASNN